LNRSLDGKSLPLGELCYRRQSDRRGPANGLPPFYAGGDLGPGWCRLPGTGCWTSSLREFVGLISHRVASPQYPAHFQRSAVQPESFPWIRRSRNPSGRRPRRSDPRLPSPQPGTGAPVVGKTRAPNCPHGL